MLLWHFPIILKTQKTLKYLGFLGAGIFFFNWRIIVLQCCVGSAIQHYESAISIRIFSPSWASLPPPQPHPTPLGCHRAPRWVPVSTSKFPLAIYILHMVIYVSVLFSQFVPPSSPAVSTAPFSMCPYSYSKNSFIGTIFLDSIYMT